MRVPAKAILVSVLVLVALAAASEKPTLKSLYDQHRWFELREAIKSNKQAPALYLGALASAFNETKEAEKDLNRAIALAPNSDDAVEAHETLGYLYARSGRYREVVQQLDSILKIKPGRADVANVRTIYAAFSRHPDLSLGRARRATVHADVSKDGIGLPVSIHGKTVHWALDTDFNFSAMSESEARLLGVAVDEVSAQASDLAGGTAKVRTAVVDELVIGGVQLRNVAFVIFQDSQLPLDDTPPGNRGLVGFPVALALQTIGWKSDGTFEIGFAARHRRNSKINLSFDGLNPVTRVTFEGKQLDFILDTGNQAGTEMWGRFADDFATLAKERGTKSKQTVTEIGGSNEREATILPEIRLRVGGLDAKLPHAPVFAKPVGDEFHYGLLGMDVYSQAREVRIDFRSMTIQLLP